MSAEDYDDVGWVVSSQYRLAVLKNLDESPGTPTAITQDTDVPGIAHVSRALQELRDREMVDLLVSEDRKKGRIYGITDGGEAVLATARGVRGGQHV